MTALLWAHVLLVGALLVLVAVHLGAARLSDD